MDDLLLDFRRVFQHKLQRQNVIQAKLFPSASIFTSTGATPPQLQ